MWVNAGGFGGILRVLHASSRERVAVRQLIARHAWLLPGVFAMASTLLVVQPAAAQFTPHTHDPRSGEMEQFLIRIAEKVEGGFGGGAPIPIEKATVTASIIQTNGTKVADSLAVKAEADGNYRVSYNFGSTGDYKIVFSIATGDGRNFSADFPGGYSAPVFR